ncbi:hypothetical protein GOODEAATRI_004134 [Goodea atripinnis]|uniref:Uncharacterized protein n=1 Tax=Goodea atripinnis TaxID=208336 RepID=A0ABV0PL17_9TELE
MMSCRKGIGLEGGATRAREDSREAGPLSLRDKGRKDGTGPECDCFIKCDLFYKTLLSCLCLSCLPHCYPIDLNLRTPSPPFSVIIDLLPVATEPQHIQPNCFSADNKAIPLLQRHFQTEALAHFLTLLMDNRRLEGSVALADLRRSFLFSFKKVQRKAVIL